MALKKGSKVLVTGISGYLGCHVARALAQAGYAVRGTVRDHKWDTQIEAAVGKKVEFVVVDLADGTQEEWNRAVTGCSGVCHVASPFFIAEPKDPNELIIPAVEGTKKVLRACHAAGVKRVALTSSTAAIGYGHPLSKTDFDESDWSVEANSPTYQLSKTLAERAAWEYARESGMELVALNPTAIFGPALLPRVGETGAVVKRFLEGAVPGIPKISMDLVDVRDVAVAHVRALEAPGAAGKRFILNSQSVWMADVAEWLQGAVPGYVVKTNKVPYPIMWLVSFFDSQAKSIIPRWGQMRRYDTSAAAAELGFAQFRPMPEALEEHAVALEAQGLLDPSKKRANA